MEVSHIDEIERPSNAASECLPLLHEPSTNILSSSPLPHVPSEDVSVCNSSSKRVQHLILDGKGSNWHQSPIFAPQDKDGKSVDSLPVLDFDLLCASIAMQREPLSVDIQRDACEVGVQRMWEGGVLDCFESREIALQTFCCPSITYGKNLNRAGFGSCITKAYASYYRIQIRRRFNIKGSDLDGIVSAIDDSLNHFICGCCALCQEARTLEINNVQDGNWRGRGDTIWVGSYAMPTGSQSIDPSELREPVVITISSEDRTESDGHSWAQHQQSSDRMM
eukprot:c16064_g1_i2 orf=555-1391(+)